MDSVALPVMVWLRLRAWDNSPLSTLRLASSLQLHVKGLVRRMVFCRIVGFYWPSYFFRSFVKELSRCQMLGRSMDTIHPVLRTIQGARGWGQEVQRSPGWAARLLESRNLCPAEYRATMFRRRWGYRRLAG